jgi:hypothetical protein
VIAQAFVKMLSQQLKRIDASKAGYVRVSEETLGIKNACSS